MRSRIKKMKRTDCNSVLYIRGISNSLKDYFKAYCARRGKNMSQVIKEFMRESTKTYRAIDREQQGSQK